MELFDIIELESYVTPLAERLRIAEEAQRNESPPNLPNATGSSRRPTVRRDWTAAAHNDAPSDLLLSANDSTIFRVHWDHILAASVNGFNEELSSHLPQGSDTGAALPVLDIPYSSAVVNLLLHVVYKEDPNDRGRVATPSLTDLSATLCALKVYGIPLKTSISETSMLHGMLSSHCQHSALRVYTLAASYAPDLHHVAVYASHFLLSMKFSLITDEMATLMGPMYLLRLYTLLSGRTREFKRLLLANPHLHESLPQCDTRGLRKVWILATGYLIWAAAPDLEDATMDNVKASVIDRVQCEQCKAALEQRIETLKSEWSLVQSTI